MENLCSLTDLNISNIILKKQEISVEIPGEVAKFKTEIPDLDLTKPREFPPSSIILTAEGVVHVAVYADSDLSGKFTQLPVYIYAQDGIILYSELPNGNYRADIKWPKSH